VTTVELECFQETTTFHLGSTFAYSFFHQTSSRPGVYGVG